MIGRRSRARFGWTMQSPDSGANADAKFGGRGQVAVVLGLLAVVVGCLFWLPRLLVPPLSGATLQAKGVTDPRDRVELEHDRLRLENEARVTLFQGLGAQRSSSAPSLPGASSRRTFATTARSTLGSARPRSPSVSPGPSTSSAARRSMSAGRPIQPRADRIRLRGGRRPVQGRPRPAGHCGGVGGLCQTSGSGVGGRRAVARWRRRPSVTPGTGT